MKVLRYTLLADGSSDQTLIPILNWLFDRYHPNISYRSQFAQRFPSVSLALAHRAREAVKYYPCDVLFVHRDAERESYESRVAEIRRGIEGVFSNLVPVVPVRMTEAWLLSDEAAIRRAAGNTGGSMPLNLPSVREWDKKSDPKEILFAALRTASGHTGRKLRTFSPEKERHRVAEITEDFSPLERLPAFAALRDDIAQVVQNFVAGHH